MSSDPSSSPQAAPSAAVAVAAAASATSSNKKRFRCHSNYFVPGDLVWVRPAKLPYWPAEVLYSHEPSNTVRARLMNPPPAEQLEANLTQETRLHASRQSKLTAKRKKLEAKRLASTEPPSEAAATSTAAAAAHDAQAEDYEEVPLCADVVTSNGLTVFFFDKMRTPEEIEECMEVRLRRGSHDVSAYESFLYRAVLQTNRLARVVLSPEKLRPYSVCGVGIVHSLMRTHIAAPRQPHTGTFVPQTAVIRLKKGLENAARNLEGFEYIWVLFQFSYASAFATGEGQESLKRLADEVASASEPATRVGGDDTTDEEKQSAIVDPLTNWRKQEGITNSVGFKPMVVPPRDDQLRGVFATRSPHRPNFIGLSCVRLVTVHGLDIHIADHDLLHGTPVLDIKPYLPFCDAHPDAKAGWVEALDASGRGKGDHKFTEQLTRVDRVVEDDASGAQ